MVAQNLDILVCDDEPSLREALRQSFEREGHRVMAVPDGPRGDRPGQHAALRHPAARRRARARRAPTGTRSAARCASGATTSPIIMLTALDCEADAVLGLEAGADDYVVKPFRPAELRSRIRAVLRRSGGSGRVEAQLSAGPIALDPGPREVRRDGEAVALTFSEFELLHALMRDPKRVHSRHDLLRAIWGDSAYRDPRAIDVHVRHLREKLEAVPEDPQLIVTVRGAGYRIGET